MVLYLWYVDGLVYDQVVLDANIRMYISNSTTNNAILGRSHGGIIPHNIHGGIIIKDLEGSLP